MGEWMRALTARVAPVAVLLVLGVAGVAAAVLGEGGFASAVTFAATAAVSAAVLGCAALVARSASPVPPTRIRTAIRDREQRTAFLPQRDPDASGRSRPRAPGRPSLTAA
ncbi:DUF6412 domain-containing protein [Streptomyces sp. NPDC051211]|uniref:DUF6412 domain-containing protein n=1 Tax=Streptomyces sp. NPDC051211 TaxID=3154643 RepID=UPI00344BBA5B